MAKRVAWRLVKTVTYTYFNIIIVQAIVLLGHTRTPCTEIPITRWSAAETLRKSIRDSQKKQLDYRELRFIVIIAALAAIGQADSEHTNSWTISGSIFADSIRHGLLAC